MDNEKAKLILSAYPHDGRLAEDPAFAESLRQVESDPQLREWFDDQRAFDREVSRKLNALPAPPELRSRILAGGEISRLAPWWKNGKILALAAGIVLLCALAPIFMGPPGDDAVPGQMAGLKPEAFRSDAVEVLQSSFELDKKDNRLVNLTGWLEGRGAPVPEEFPEDFRSDRLIGCKTFDWQGQRVSLVCTRLDTGEIVHSLVIGADHFRQIPDQPQFEVVNGMSTAIWKKDGMIYLLAGNTTESKLRSLIL